ncbi:MAG TPA: Re/Si-specific NAD(P)(+) transhydrogenase subunit alpha [Solirubrobacteraceae bacterium]|jgi:NAD(P) transhydrogenase subunit alpha|nr:Re/Si-specific NAD(P)(+) transhydrogenase subunit alpha [Solirubrobacteraceae bacterium]
MKVGVPKETAAGESRVALVPEVIRKMAAKGFELVVEPGAGDAAMLSDALYESAGATLSGDVWTADVVAKVAAPSDDEIAKLGDGTVLVGFLGPLTNTHGVSSLAAAGVTSFAMEAIPRISRAQSMDALSSQSNVAGYKSVLLATQHLGRFFPMMMTAAGTVPPARVLVLGAGVAGLQAIATARRLGAQVTGYDVRAAVAEQVRSLGAAFLELEAGKNAEGEGGYARELTDDEKAAQQTELADKIATFDVVITTALVPGRRAPILVTAHSVENMKAGSVIVDLAGESGGNCELTEPGEVVVKHGVTIVSPLNLPATMPEHASALYARNVQSLLELLVDDDGALNLNFDDEIIVGACITRGGEIVHPGAKKAVQAQAATAKDAE